MNGGARCPSRQFNNRSPWRCGRQPDSLVMKMKGSGIVEVCGLSFFFSLVFDCFSFIPSIDEPISQRTNEAGKQFAQGDRIVKYAAGRIQNKREKRECR